MTPETEPEANDWNKWQVYVLKELKRIGDCMAELQRDIVNVKVRVATVSASVAVVVSLIVSLVVWGLKQ